VITLSDYGVSALIARLQIRPDRLRAGFLERCFKQSAGFGRLVILIVEQIAALRHIILVPQSIGR